MKRPIPILAFVAARGPRPVYRGAMMARCEDGMPATREGQARQRSYGGGVGAEIIR